MVCQITSWSKWPRSGSGNADIHNDADVYTYTDADTDTNSADTHPQVDTHADPCSDSDARTPGAGGPAPSGGMKAMLLGA